MDVPSYPEILVGFSNQLYDVTSIYVARTNQGALATKHTLFRFSHSLFNFSSTNAVAKLPKAETGEISGSAGGRTAPAGYAEAERFVSGCNPVHEGKISLVQIVNVYFKGCVAKVNHSCFILKNLWISIAAERAEFIESVMLLGPEHAPAVYTPLMPVSVGLRW